jgi:hypothetical protein
MDGALLMPNVEEHEQAMDAQWATASARHRGDLYDAGQDARSDARYEWSDADTETERITEQRWEGIEA